MINFDFKDQHVMVIGGTSGINRGIAEGFALLGAKLTVASRSQQKVDDTVAHLKTLTGEAQGFTADVREFDALQAGINQACEKYGNIQVLVSGAAGNFPCLLNNMSPNGFKSVMDIDLLGTFHAMRAAYPHLQKPGASVINISAPQAQMATLAQAHVCAAKAGVDMITKTLCNEWGPEGIRINSVIPGPIEGTEGMARLAPSPQAIEMCKNTVPLRRMGQTEDVANACILLSSPLASFISGAVVPADGGWLQGGAALAATAFAQSSQS